MARRGDGIYQETLMAQTPCAHLTPNTHEWHAGNVGMLIGNLQSLEFGARAAVATMTGDMTDAWFAQQRKFIFEAVQAVNDGLAEWNARIQT